MLEHYEPPLLALYRAHAREGPVLRVRALVALLRGHGLIGGAASRNPPHPPPPQPHLPHLQYLHPRLLHAPRPPPTRPPAVC